MLPNYGVFPDERKHYLPGTMGTEAISMKEVSAGNNEYAGWYWRRK